MTDTPNDGSDDRKFLHDMASPLAAALFLADIVLDSAQAQKEIDPDHVLQLGQIYESLEKMKKMLHERREVLIKRGVPSART